MSVVAAPLRSDRVWLLTTGILLAGAAALFVGLVSAYGTDQLGYDFRAAYLPAAEAVRDGHSPYPSPGDASVVEGTAYVYPPQLAIALVPFTALPVDVAALLASLLAGAALAGALLVLGVRDVRCYAATMLWAPTWNALEMANASALLVLALAIAWRYRDGVWRPAVALGAAVSAKLVLWPLLVWTAARGAVRATLCAIGVGAGLTAAGWGLLGFAGIGDYPDLLQRLGDAQAGSSYSFVGLASALGLSETVGHALALAVGGALVVACAARSRAGDDVRAMTWAVAASLALSPIVWQHYLVLLLVPLAIARPRFSAVWLLPIVLWASPRAGHGAGIEPFLPFLVVVCVVAVVVGGRQTSTRTAPEAT